MKKTLLAMVVSIAMSLTAVAHKDHKHHHNHGCSLHGFWHAVMHKESAEKVFAQATKANECGCHKVDCYTSKDGKFLGVDGKVLEGDAAKAAEAAFKAVEKEDKAEMGEKPGSVVLKIEDKHICVVAKFMVPAPCKGECKGCEHKGCKKEHKKDCKEECKKECKDEKNCDDDCCGDCDGDKAEKKELKPAEKTAA